MNPIAYLCYALDRLFERSPVAGIIVAIVLAFVCMVAIAYLNQDGTAVVTTYVRKA